MNVFIWVLVFELATGSPNVLRSVDGFETKEKCEAQLVAQVAELNVLLARDGKKVVGAKCATEAEMKEQPS